MCLVIDSWRDIDTIVSIPLRKGTVEHRYELVLECFVAIDYFNRVRCQVRCQVPRYGARVRCQVRCQVQYLGTRVLE